MALWYLCYLKEGAILWGTFLSVVVAPPGKKKKKKKKRKQIAWYHLTELPKTGKENIRLGHRSVI